MSKKTRNIIRELQEENERLKENHPILPRLETILYRKHRYYCKGCKRVVSGLGKNELPKSYIGPKAKTFAAFLKYAVKVSERDIRNIFEQAFDLKISPSSITGFREKITREACFIYERLLEELKKGKFIHIDETGWRVDSRKFTISSQQRQQLKRGLTPLNKFI